MLKPRHRQQHRRFTSSALLAAALAVTPLLAGCNMMSWFDGESSSQTSVSPSDFVRISPNPTLPSAVDNTPPKTNAKTNTETDAASDPARNATASSTPGNNPAANPAEPLQRSFPTALGSVPNANTPAAPADANTPTPLKPDNSVSVNAMVGYINSEAVYADQIFDVNLIAQLQAFGRRYDGEQFRNAASAVISERLRGIIINKLILGEAEMQLKPRERDAINQRVQLEREELLRFYGQGSISRARAEFRKARGEELDVYLDNYRDELSVTIFVRSQVLPKISVSQINIENWYEDNKDKYNQPDLRSFRILRAPDAETADRVAKLLKDGESFAQLAANPQLNTYNPDNAGIFNNGEPLPGDKVYGIEPVNDAIMQLDVDEHTGPITAGTNFFFAQLVSYEPGVKRKLSDVQLEIEETLRALEFERQVLRFRMGLFKRGSYTDPEAMGAKLLDIAYARYDQ